jgi:hypothetical protein
MNVRVRVRSPVRAPAPGTPPREATPCIRSCPFDTHRASTRRCSPSRGRRR